MSKKINVTVFLKMWCEVCMEKLEWSDAGDNIISVLPCERCLGETEREAAKLVEEELRKSKGAEE